MSGEAMNKEGFDTAVKQALVDAEGGRADIVAELAGLSLEALAKVPASKLALLGPGGLGRLVAVRGDLPDGLASPEPRAGMLQASKPGRASVTVSRAARKKRARIANMIAGTLGLLVLMSGPIFDTLRPFAERTLDSGWRPVDASGWPRCKRLDAYVDGCLYRIGGGVTTLDEIAAHLELPPAQLTASNRHLAADTRRALARGSDVVVWRGRPGLGGPRP